MRDQLQGATLARHSGRSERWSRKQQQLSDGGRTTPQKVCYRIQYDTFCMLLPKPLKNRSGSGARLLQLIPLGAEHRRCLIQSLQAETNGLEFLED